MSVRRSIIKALAGQYSIMVINLATTLVMARLLSPAEFGIAAIALAVIYIAEAFREVGGGTFLVRERELSPEKVRSTFTVSVLATIAVVAVLLCLADPLAAFFAVPGLALYLKVVCLGFCLGPVTYPLMALMNRQLEFGNVAAINLAATLVRVVFSIGLAWLGFSAMSLAWAEVAAAGTTAALSLAMRGDISLFRPTLEHARAVIGFGAYSSLTGIFSRFNEALPMLFFGKLFGAEASALSQRALLLCLLPQRVVMSAIGAVALPVLSQQARDGGDLKASYLRALSTISAVEWPAVLVLAVLAEPIVLLLLGPSWLEVAPLVQILGPAAIFALPIGLQYPVLVAVGGIQDMPRLLVAQSAVMGTALALTAPYGLHAAAMSMFLALPINSLLSLKAVRRRIAFGWLELASMLLGSALATALAVAGPLLIGWYYDPGLSVFSTLAAIAAATLGWAIGLYITRHPLRDEIGRTRALIAQRA